jgi:hypothetical protein
VTGREGNPLYSGQADVDEERLAYMAEGYVDNLTMRRLHELGLNNQDTVLDVGAGTSINLGEQILKAGAGYIPLDRHPQAVRTHQQAGHDRAVQASVSGLPLADDSISLVNARFVMGWLSQPERAQAWDELLRVGKGNLRGIITDYDWSVADGPPEFTALIKLLHTALIDELGFEPDYGSRLYDDVCQQLALRLGAANFRADHITQAIPANSLAEKKVITQLTAKSVIDGLRNQGRVKQAAIINDSLETFLKTQPAAESIVLSHIATVCFELGRAAVKAAPAAPQSTYAAGKITPALPEIDPADTQVPIWRIGPASPEHPLRQRARELFTIIYRQSGYISPVGIGDEAMRRAIDPEELYRRSEVFVATGQGDHPLGCVRLIHPSDTYGATSLPTVQKVFKQHDLTDLPLGADNDQKIGEIAYFASQARNPLVSLKLIIALMEAAAEAGIEYGIFGAVSSDRTPEDPDKYFKKLFGTAIHPLLIDGEQSIVNVDGPGYRPGGIALRVSYLKTADFLQNMINYYQTSYNKHAEYIIKLCNFLRARRLSESSDGK